MTGKFARWKCMILGHRWVDELYGPGEAFPLVSVCSRCGEEWTALDDANFGEVAGEMHPLYLIDPEKMTINRIKDR